MQITREIDPSLEDATPVRRNPSSSALLEPGFPALYLEERIGSASRLADRLGATIERAGPRSAEVDRDLEELHDELRRASRELEFLGTEVGFGFDRRTTPPRGKPIWDESVDEPATGSIDPAPEAVVGVQSGPSGVPAFCQFTATRYDRTVRQLKARRRRIFGWTVGLAAGISIALEVLNVLAREPMPPWWLALLPLVWLIPVPFFVLAFRGTQRTLRANHLETGVSS